MKSGLSGNPTTSPTHYAVESVLHHYFGVSLDEGRRAKIVRKVEGDLNATVNESATAADGVHARHGGDDALSLNSNT